MTIDESLKKTHRLLWSLYEATGKDTFTIRGDILKDEGLDSDTFWSLVCPKLVKDGVLTETPKVNDENVPTVQTKDLTMYKQYRAFLFSIDKNKLLEAINRGEPHLDIKDSKINIGINLAKGIYLPGRNVNYPISGQRLAIIKKLLESEFVSIGDIADLTGWDNADISRTISKINKSFADKLKVKDKLINHLDTGGYTLNKENFNISSEI